MQQIMAGLPARLGAAASSSFVTLISLLITKQTSVVGADSLLINFKINQCNVPIVLLCIQGDIVFQSDVLYQVMN